ncbi:MFS transporter [Rubellicoccus peritrichatus]|uniref:MFS transporter n=1 Tax=Rubellicoccus peritrichatus TaxID=3080537 RepID=A0AAQ3LBM8_9BACT|nr:MFS transporter [Puniceicoccus sp. CR14]WOO42431.1 MFS transporter [Puniceicoccus sp. CR14]
MEHKTPDYARRNYLAHFIDGGLFMGGMAFIAADSVLPAAVSQLGGPNWLISLMPILGFIGFIWPPIFTAGLIERCSRMKPLCLISGIPQRLPFLIAGLILIWKGEEDPMLALIAVAATPLISGMFGGLTMPAWIQLMAKTVRAQRRSSLTGMRNTLGALIGILAAIVVKHVLENYPGATGFGILYLACFSVMAISWLFFSTIKEVPTVSSKEPGPFDLKRYVKDLVTLAVEDKLFRLFCVMRVFGQSFFMSLPFVAISVLDAGKLNDSFLGVLVGTQVAGSIIGNLVGAYFGDRHGGKIVILMSRILLFLAVAMMIHPAAATGIAFFFFFGIGNSLSQIGAVTLMMEMAPEETRPSYTALAMFVAAPSMLLFTLLGSVLWSAFGSIQLLAMVGLFGMGISLILLLRVPEPRKSAV